MTVIVLFLRGLCLASGGVFAVIVFSDFFGVVISGNISVILTATSLTVCLLTMPMLFTFLMKRSADIDEQTNAWE